MELEKAKHCVAIEEDYMSHYLKRIPVGDTKGLTYLFAAKDTFDKILAKNMGYSDGHQ